MLANERVRDSDSETSNLLGITKRLTLPSEGSCRLPPVSSDFLFVFSGLSHKLINARDFQPTDITGFINNNNNNNIGVYLVQI